QRHPMTLQQLHLDHGLRMFSASQILVDADRCTLAVRNTVDDQPWTKNTTLAGKDAGGRCHQGLRIDRDQSTGRDVNFVFRSEEVEPWRLPDRPEDRGGFEWTRTS